MGVDPSLTATAAVVLSDGQILFQGIIKSKVKGVARLSDLESQFQKLIKDNPVSLIAIEGYAYGMSKSSMLASLGELGGLLRVAMHRAKVSYVNVSPGTLKKFVTGKGNHKKEQMLMFTLQKWGVAFEDNNLCDAYGLARVAEAVLTGESSSGNKTLKKLAAEIRAYDASVNPKA